MYCTPFCELFPGKSFKFVHLDFVKLLSAFCGKDPDIIRDLTIQSLATEFLPDVFIEKLPLNQRKHVSWDYPENGVLSQNWFSQFWEFLQGANCEKRTNPVYEHRPIETSEVVKNTVDIIAEYLGKFPIIPTTDRKLATVGNAKSVLAVTRYASRSSFLESEVTQILKKLACPFLDESITKRASSFVRGLVADPHCESDVLHVLDYMNETGILDLSKFDDNIINILLRFFQADSENEKSMDIAKTLPFYKGVDGDYHALSSYFSYIQVPVGIPEDGIKELQSLYEKRILFLSPLLATDLGSLYKALGMELDCKIPDLYVSYVLPFFSRLSSKSQKEFLANIKDLPGYHETVELIEKLKHTKCIPDQTGNLRIASKYFNPHDDLFKVMFKLEDNVFPKAPFNESSWIRFLIKIGMKEDCDEQQFVQFALKVQNSARDISDYDQNIVTQSEALVKYLLQNGTTWHCSDISQIQFIVPQKVEEELSSFQAQYRVDEMLEFVSYSDSVPWEHRHVVWTSAKLLPSWAHPGSHNLSLGIPSKPPLDSVVEHVKIISKRASEMVKSGPLSNEITKIFETVYNFLKDLVQNCAKEPSSDCNHDCQSIGSALAPVACILLSEERQLVKGERLSFENTDGKLKPHFHVAPRDVCTHLLKRLGVTEKLTASQMSNVLESIKNSCAEVAMNSEEEEKACFAASALFKSLHGNSSTDV